MSLLDDENILMEEIKNTIPVDIIKNLWNEGKVRDIEKILNENYVHDKTFQWKFILWDGNFSYGKMNNYVSTSIFLCDLDMDRESRLVLRFDLVTLHSYFKYADKEDKFMRDVLGLFGDCMKETFFKPQIEICYGC